MSKKHPAKTPTNYVSPLAAGQDFFFAPPRTVYPYYEGGPSNKYELTVTYNGKQIGEDHYLIIVLPNGDIERIGNDDGVTTKLKSGVYTAFYQYTHESASGGDYATATYRFEVVENQYPLKKQTIKEVIERILDVAEPLVVKRNDDNTATYVKPPRFKFEYKYPEDTEDGKAERALFNQTAPEFTFTRMTLRECLQEIGKFIHAEPRLTKNCTTWIYDRYGEQDFATYTPEYVGVVESMLNAMLHEEDFEEYKNKKKKYIQYLRELVSIGGHAKKFAEPLLKETEEYERQLEEGYAYAENFATSDLTVPQNLQFDQEQEPKTIEPEEPEE